MRLSKVWALASQHPPRAWAGTAPSLRRDGSGKLTGHRAGHRCTMIACPGTVPWLWGWHHISFGGSAPHPHPMVLADPRTTLLSWDWAYYLGQHHMPHSLQVP